MFTRSKNNPILKPNPKNFWESRKVYNPAAFYEDGRYYLFYRAIGEDWISRIGLATSPDGENFSRSDKPLLEPAGELETKGVEDPRITKIQDTYYLTYNALSLNADGKAAVNLCLATSNDLKNWQRHGAMLPDWDFTKAGGVYTKFDENGKPFVKPKQNSWSKGGGIFPEKINNQFLMLFGEYRMWLATSDDGIKWTGEQKPFLEPRPGNYFDNTFVEMGPPPLKTDKGWLVLYHGVNKKHWYQIGFLLLDLNNPRKILFRSKEPIFEPTEPYELSGLVDVLPGGVPAMQKMSPEELNKFIKEATAKKIMPRVVFCCGAVPVGGILKLYYGAGDSVIGLAEAPLAEVISSNKL